MEKYSRVAVAAHLAILAVILAPSLSLGSKKKESAPAYGVIAGSVFQESGLSLRGAEVMVVSHPDEDSPANKEQVLKAITDSRGEFAVRVPSGAMRYTVRVKAKGFQPQEKAVSVHYAERLELYFRLKTIRDDGGASK